MNVHRWLIDDGMFATPLRVLDEILSLCMEDSKVEQRGLYLQSPKVKWYSLARSKEHLESVLKALE